MASTSGLAAGTTTAADQADSESTTVNAQFEKTKMDGLREAAVLIREALADAQGEIGIPTIVVASALIPRLR